MNGLQIEAQKLYEARLQKSSSLKIAANTCLLEAATAAQEADEAKSPARSEQFIRTALICFLAASMFIDDERNTQLTN